MRKLDRIRTDMNLTQPAILFDVEVFNPNDFGVTLQKVNVFLSLGEKELAGIHTERHLRIGRKGNSTLPVVLRPSYDDLSAMAASGLNQFLGGKKQPISISGDITVRKFLFKRKIRFREEISF